ncbi:MAG: head decoration protein [Abyssibacter sp.]|uniref:head decoration protein n=1 Tax=Abyssibacter sp. TaxID=2320200 RepID=UPI00321B5124
MAVKTEARHPGEHVASEAKGTRSREVVTLTGTVFQPGQVLGKITASSKYAPWDPAGSDGTETAAGICLDHYDASSEDVKGVIHIRDMEAVLPALIFPDTATQGEKDQAVADLLALGIKCLDGGVDIT